MEILLSLSAGSITRHDISIGMFKALSKIKGAQFGRLELHSARDILAFRVKVGSKLRTFSVKATGKVTGSNFVLEIESTFELGTRTRVALTSETSGKLKVKTVADAVKAIKAQIAQKQDQAKAGVSGIKSNTSSVARTGVVVVPLAGANMYEVKKNGKSLMIFKSTQKVTARKKAAEFGASVLSKVNAILG